MRNAIYMDGNEESSRYMIYWKKGLLINKKGYAEDVKTIN